MQLCGVRYAAEARANYLADAIAELITDDLTDPKAYLVLTSAVDWLNKGWNPRAASFADNVMARELRNSNRGAACTPSPSAWFTRP